jgi:O-antigen/teichoic acid export membrane protein
MFWRGVLGYLPVNIVQAVAGFGTIVVFTRLLSPEQYGDYALGFSVASLAATTLFTWNEAAMARFYAAESGDQNRRALFGTIYRTFWVMALVLPLVSALVLWLCPFSMGLKLAVTAGLASSLVRSLLKLAQERRRAAGAVGGFALIDMMQTGGAFLIGAGLAYAGLGGAAPLAGAGIASGLCLIFTLPGELKLGEGGHFDPQRFRSYAAYGLPVTLSLVMSLAIANTDRFVIAGFLGTGAVGAYHAGYSLANRTLDVMFIWLGMAGGPAAIAALERGGHGELQRVARSQASLMILLSLPASAGLALVAKPLAQLMVGPALSAQAASVTVWIAASAAFSGLTTYYFHTAFTLSRRTGRLLLAMAIPAVANLGLALALIPAFGLNGAMWATTASYFLGLCCSILLGRDCIALPIPWETLAKASAATAFMAVALQFLPSPGGLLELALKAGAGMIVYAASAVALDLAGVRGQLARLSRGERLELSL